VLGVSWGSQHQPVACCSLVSMPMTQPSFNQRLHAYMRARVAVVFG
jgi:hypothetical protein